MTCNEGSGQLWIGSLLDSWEWRRRGRGRRRGGSRPGSHGRFVPTGTIEHSPGMIGIDADLSSPRIDPSNLNKAQPSS